VRRQNLIALIVLALTLTLFVAPLAFADSPNGNAHTIKVWPVGTTTQTGMPIVTGTPADLFILHTGQDCIKNVWLLIVLSEPTYTHLDMITINGNKFMDKTDFQLVTASKIPPLTANTTTGYPGATWQYEVSAIRSNMNEAKKANLYYGVKYFLPKITTAPTKFTLAVILSSPASIKALILGLGKSDPSKDKCFGIECNDNRLDRFTSFSKSTLVTPEIAPLALMASPFAALGLLAIKRRKK
jgi:hypothetical protein